MWRSVVALFLWITLLVPLSPAFPGATQDRNRPAAEEEFEPLYPDTEVRGLFRDLGTEQVRLEEPDPLSHTKGRRIFSQVSEPAYAIVRAEKSANSGVAVVLLPGGAFVDLWLDKEGTDIARWLAKRGVTSMILKYSTLEDGSGQEIMPWTTYQDAVKRETARAIEVLRERSPQLGVDPGKIGMMGFSAGGAVVHWHLFDKKKDGQCCTANTKTRPAFVGLIYGSAFRDGKADPPLPLLDDPHDLPPIYMAAARDDGYIDFNGPHYVQFFFDVIGAVPRSELHVYGVGGHGFALDKRGYAVSTWLDGFYLWLRDLGMLP